MSLILDGSVGVSDVDGSAATPAIRGTDANTGMFFPAADTIAFSEGGVETMRLDSAGNVGIGTASPAQRLDVNGTANFGNINTGNGISTGTASIELGGLRTGDGVSLIDFHSVASTDYESRILRVGGANGALQIINTGTGDYRLVAAGAAPMIFDTSSTERMRIDSSGNVGIGISSPESGFRLHVLGNAFIQPTSGQNIGKVVVDSVDQRLVLGSYFEAGVGQYAFISSTNNAETGNLDLYFRTGTTDRMVITSSGNVGIGTSSPASRLNVAGGNITLSAGNGITWSGDQNRIMTPEDNVSGALIRWAGGGICRFLNGSTETMRLTGSGAVVLQGGATNPGGIGITFPATQSASSDANTLDDYEEGTWTPVLQFGGGSTGITYASRAGSYVKVGKQITCQGRIDLSNKGSSTGGANLAGLPFTLDGGSIGAGSVGFQSAIAPSDKQVMLTLDPNSAALVIRYASGTSTAQSTNSDFTNSSTLIFSITYMTN